MRVQFPGKNVTYGHLSALLNRVTCIHDIIQTSRVPVDGKSSVCVICMKYRIIILIIIIISLGQIILSYIWQTHHARTHARTHPPTTVQVVTVRWLGVRPTMTKLMPSFRVFRWR